MGKMELEVKILNINERAFIEKLEKLGAEFVESNNQILYTYDMPTSYSRYIDILTQLNKPESDIKYETALAKLRLLFFDLDNLLNEVEKKEVKSIINRDLLSELLDREDILEFLNSQELIKFMEKFNINPKKWIRVRETNNKVTIAVKHVLADNGTGIQQLLESEFEIPSLEEGNSFLEALGFSHKSYQEKRRITYSYLEYEIDIDTWPGIPTYAEIEGKSENDLIDFLEKLGYSIADIVSCSADDIFQMYGKSMFEKRELKFDDK